jgi:predicted enzyme related to lactoylglutathione lyase
MVCHHGRFAWYELLTTDLAGAKAFYAHVVGWDARDESTPDLAYTVFGSGTAWIGGLMNLPADALQMGASPRWMGYVGVNDVDETADRLVRLGGAVYVPPTDSNIGRVSVVADPQTAVIGLVQGLKPAPLKPAAPDEPGRVGWHELLAANWPRAFAFYAAIFGWQKTDAESGAEQDYQLFSAAGLPAGGMFTKRPVEPVPYWLYYLNVGDMDAALARVRSGGGRVFEGPFEVPEGSWIARCIDPQGAIFALQGQRSKDAVARDPGMEIGWSTEWSGISSRGKLVARPPKPR